MEINDLVEKILTRVALLTDMEVFIADDQKLIYYLGNADKVCEYLYSEISDDLKTLKSNRYFSKLEYVGEKTIPLLKCDMDKMQSEVIYKFKNKWKFDKFLIFAKTSSAMNDEDRFLIDSAIRIIRKCSQKNLPVECYD